MYNGGFLTMTNCTMTGNSSGIYNEVGVLTLTNCILWGNISGEINDSVGLAWPVTYSNIQGGYAGTGNIDADPLFVDPDGADNIPGTEDDDLHLLPGSPCIDAGDNTAPGLVGITEDLDGNPRFVDDPGTADTGNGDPPNVDMGAYEFAACPLLGDLNADLVVNGLDVMGFLDCLITGDTPGGDCTCANMDGVNGVTLDDQYEFLAVLLVP